MRLTPRGRAAVAASLALLVLAVLAVLAVRDATYATAWAECPIAAGPCP